MNADTRRRRRWLVGLALLLLVGVALIPGPDPRAQGGAGSVGCGAAVEVTGLNRLLSTLWGYTTGTFGKVVAAIIFLIGVGEVVTHHYQRGILAVISAFGLAMAGAIVSALFTAGGGIGATLC